MGIYIDVFDGIPFDGQLDFSRIAEELAACGYRGNITLELCYNEHYRRQMTQTEFLKKSFAAAQKLQAMIAR